MQEPGQKKGGAAFHDVLEIKGVSSGMAKTLPRLMSLKLSGLAYSWVARGTKKIPPKKSASEA